MALDPGTGGSPVRRFTSRAMRWIGDGLIATGWHAGGVTLEAMTALHLARLDAGTLDGPVSADHPVRRPPAPERTPEPTPHR